MAAGRVWGGVVVGVVGLVLGGVLVVHEVRASGHGLHAAARGDSAACRRVVDGYPSGLAGLERADVGVPGAAVWGDGAVTARCGLEPPAATIDACVNVDDVDWVWRPKAHDGRKVLVTYGRDPAVEIEISDRVTAVDDVLVELSGAVRPLAPHARCIGEDDVPAIG
ncbi:DUF3515 family protein [Streptomyces sp. NPDC006668]|uniref:DUF3515 family protein n=1 Tax=Streptomyces sp. NPDC006668 TaxID=3156903 RepID=UPI0033E6DA12